MMLHVISFYIEVPFWFFLLSLYKQSLSQTQMLLYKLGPKQLFWVVDKGGKWARVNDAVIIELATFKKFEVC